MLLELNFHDKQNKQTLIHFCYLEELQIISK